MRQSYRHVLVATALLGAGVDSGAGTSIEELARKPRAFPDVCENTPNTYLWFVPVAKGQLVDNFAIGN